MNSFNAMKVKIVIFVLILVIGGLMFSIVKNSTKPKTHATITKYDGEEFITYTYEEQEYNVNIKDNEKFKKYENGDKLKIHVDKDDPNKFKPVRSTSMQVGLMVFSMVVVFGLFIYDKKRYVKPRGVKFEEF